MTEIHRSGYSGADVAEPSALAQRHQLGGTGVDARSARADAPSLVLASHVAAADPHTGYVLESLLDAKGDLIAASADNTPAKVTVGANGAVLVADSTQTPGVRWENSAWTAYTPTWSSTGSAPSIGNGTLLGRYYVLGHICFVRISMALGSTSTLGTGEYRWALPFTAYLPASLNYMVVGSGHNYDSSTANKIGRLVEIPNDNGKIRFTSTSGAESATSFSVPFIWATGDECHTSFFYELA